MLKPVKNLIKKIPGVKPLLKIRNNIRAEYNYNHHQTMTYDEIEKEVDQVYFNIFNRHVNWDNPQSYNEKMQVSKIYNPTGLKTRLTDKYTVREWIKSKIGEKYLIPLYGVCDSFDEIDFENLPEQFVIKCNHDSGSVILCPDKNKFDINSARKKINRALSRDYAWPAFEMHYKNIPPKIIIEKYMGDSINDYKFLCFDGKPFYCWVDFDRFTNHKRNIYNLDWELQPFNQCEYGNYLKEVPKPKNFDEMKNIAGELCKNFDHVRVDLYVIDEKIYFGEMTFTNAGGFEKIIPDEWSYKLGALWKFDNTIRRKVREKNLKP